MSKYTDSAYTVQELIEKLIKVENKERRVFVEKDSWSIDPINSVYSSCIEGEEDIIFLGS